MREINNLHARKGNMGYERLQFLGVRIETLADGAVSEIHVGLKGTMSALFLKDLAQKTRRGQIGRVKAGRIPGGKSYGYGVLKDGDERDQSGGGRHRAPHLPRIHWQGAARDRARPQPRRRARPTGRHWNASALLGSPKRRNGILNNELYIGQIVYNRQRFLKDPATGRRISRENPEREWHRQAVPELRIIDDRTWELAQRRRAERGGPHLYQQRRPQRPLSGLLYCGACGAKFIVATHDYLRCSARTNRGTCDTSRTLLMGEVEQRVLSALRSYLLSPDVVTSAVEAYQRERKRLAEERRRSRHKCLTPLLPEGDHEAVALVRSLIGRVVVHATPAPEPLGLEVEGSLAALMTDAPELGHSGISCCRPPQPLLL